SANDHCNRYGLSWGIPSREISNGPTTKLRKKSARRPRIIAEGWNFILFSAFERLPNRQPQFRISALRGLCPNDLLSRSPLTTDDRCFPSKIYAASRQNIYLKTRFALPRP